MTIPRHAICHHTPTPLVIDGDATKPAWHDVPWSDDYTDIEGPTKPTPTYRTRSKMLWDDENLYFLAELEEPHVWATLTEHDSVVYHDNDWEIFVDAEGSNHHYYELEINALGTVFDLWLPKPYREGVKADHDWNIAGLKKAIRVHGTLNDPSDTDRGWTIEIAWPWKAFDRHDLSRAPIPPRNGDQWRLNFSRVQWDLEVVAGTYRRVKGRPEHNWVWSPQGLIDMHQPEHWGFVQFTTRPPGSPVVFRNDETWPARTLLMQFYHAQIAHRKKTGQWAATLHQLHEFQPQLAAATQGLSFHPNGEGWIATATIRTAVGDLRVHCRHDSLITVEPSPR